MRGGTHSPDNQQLCLTNAAMRREFVANLLAHIREQASAAVRGGEAAPNVYSVSLQDNPYECECAACQDLKRKYKAYSGVALDFVNEIAAAVEREHPGVLVATLAYLQTELAPTGISPRDNVLVQLCDSRSILTLPTSAPENTPFRETLQSWAKIAPQLNVWHYTYGVDRFFLGFPAAITWAQAENYRRYAQSHVVGVFAEYEFGIWQDMQDYKCWMIAKLMEDPQRDFAATRVTFLRGYYGAAAPHIGEYLTLLEEGARHTRAHVDWQSPPEAATYLTPEFFRQAEALFNRAEQAVSSDPVKSRRVRHARLALDRTLVYLHARLPATDAGLAREVPAAAERYRRAWQEQVDLRFPPAQREARRFEADADSDLWRRQSVAIPLPKRFAAPDLHARDLPGPGSLQAYYLQTVKDPLAEAGFASCWRLSDSDVNRYKLPFPCGVYDYSTKAHTPIEITVAQVSGPGYRWYRLATTALGPQTVAWFTWNWGMQVGLSTAYRPDQPNRKFEVWASIRFSGPALLPGAAAEPNAVYIERVTLVPVP